MINELVEGSAGICPPVEGCAPVALNVALALPALLGLLGVVLVWLLVVPVGDDDWAVSAARKVAANLVASAFFRYTTWMLPLAALGPESEGRSSCVIKERASAMRAALAARITKELLRASAMMVVLKEVSD